MVRSQTGYPERRWNSNWWSVCCLIVCGLAACATGKQSSSDLERGQAVYLSVQGDIDRDGENIDYETLMAVTRQMMSAPAAIPHMDELLGRLIDQRNPNPRIDQMVLICAARAMGQSKFAIPHAERLFKKILDQDAERINHWVLKYVAEAIGDYPVDLPNGNALVDRVNAWQRRIDRERTADQEYFGTHFLPPPESKIIRAHIAGIADQHARQRERSAYYILIRNKIPENSIVAAFKYLKANGLPDSGEIPDYPLAALTFCWYQLPPEVRLPPRP